MGYYGYPERRFGEHRFGQNAPATRRVKPCGDAKGDECEIGGEEPHAKLLHRRAVECEEDLRNAVNDIDRADEAREDLMLSLIHI